MKKLHSIIAAALLGIVPAAHAGNDGVTYTDWARVTRVTPQYERVNTPRQECRSERARYSAHDERADDGRSYGGAVIGGIAGGILGNQVGRGDGRTAATAVGAVVGAIVGDRIDNNGYRQARYEPAYREVQRCRTIDHWDDRLTGYQVEYEYQGRRYTQLMNEDPGRRFRVRVSVSPA